MTKKGDKKTRSAIIADIKKILNKEKKELESRLELLLKKSTDNPHSSKEDIDASVQSIAEASVKKTVDINIEKQLRDIKKALKRIEAGIYGVCKYCDEEISDARLHARPTSTSCVSCKKTLTDEL